MSIFKQFDEAFEALTKQIDNILNHDRTRDLPTISTLLDFSKEETKEETDDHIVETTTWTSKDGNSTFTYTTKTPKVNKQKELKKKLIKEQIADIEADIETALEQKNYLYAHNMQEKILKLQKELKEL